MNAIKRLREKKNANLVKACASQSAGNDYCVLLLFFVFFIFIFFFVNFWFVFVPNERPQGCSYDSPYAANRLVKIP